MYIVYYSQGIDIQLLWHIWLSESESFVAKLTSAASEFDDLPTLILTHIYGLLLFFHLFPIYTYMFLQDKHFLSRANTANEIDLRGWIEWMCRMREWEWEKEGGVRLEVAGLGGRLGEERD